VAGLSEPDRFDAFLDEPGRADRIARERASAPPGPLHGVAVGVKDIFHVDGLPTHAGSRLPAEVLTGEEGTSVRRLRAAGAVVAGKTHTAEFAWLAPGPTRNPVDPRRTPGGSSSGSAAAVAAGLVPLALGTQTVGSVIRPASYCGVVGFKPSYGRVPVDGVVACSPSVDTVGWFAPDVEGVARAGAVLCDAWEPAGSDDAVLGVPEGPLLALADPAARDVFRRVVAQLAARGWEVRPVEVLDDLDDVVDRHRRLVAAEMAAVHEPWFERFRDLYRPQTREIIEWGRTLGDVRAHRDGRGRLRDALAATGVDVWLSPAATGPAPLGLDSTGSPLLSLPWTHAGVPVLSLPVMSVAGLPLGLQLAGRRGADESLIAVGAALSEQFRSDGGREGD